MNAAVRAAIDNKALSQRDLGCSIEAKMSIAVLKVAAVCYIS
jgi:hypothetical protein